MNQPYISDQPIAQHIGRTLRHADCSLIDQEPPLRNTPPDIVAKFGYGVFSAR